MGALIGVRRVSAAEFFFRRQSGAPDGQGTMESDGAVRSGEGRGGTGWWVVLASRLET